MLCQDGAWEPVFYNCPDNSGEGLFEKRCWSLYVEENRKAGGGD
jgi:hypothetical protein